MLIILIVVMMGFFWNKLRKVRNLLINLDIFGNLSDVIFFVKKKLLSIGIFFVSLLSVVMFDVLKCCFIILSKKNSKVVIKLCDIIWNNVFCVLGVLSDVSFINIIFICEILE